MNKHQKLEETLNVLWEEISEEMQDFRSALARLKRAAQDSKIYDEQWACLATALLALKLKADDAYKLMEKVEELEAQETKV